jgi:hypothetical protein
MAVAMVLGLWWGVSVVRALLSTQRLLTAASASAAWRRARAADGVLASQPSDQLLLARSMPGASGALPKQAAAAGSVLTSYVRRHSYFMAVYSVLFFVLVAWAANLWLFDAGTRKLPPSYGLCMLETIAVGSVGVNLFLVFGLTSENLALWSSLLCRRWRGLRGEADDPDQLPGGSDHDDSNPYPGCGSSSSSNSSGSSASASASTEGFSRGIIQAPSDGVLESGADSGDSGSSNSMASAFLPVYNAYNATMPPAPAEKLRRFP